MESVGVQQLQATGVGKVVAQISRSAKSSTAPYMEGAGKAARCVGGVYSFIVGFGFINNSNISQRQVVRLALHGGCRQAARCVMDNICLCLIQQTFLCKKVT